MNSIYKLQFHYTKKVFHKQQNKKFVYQVVREGARAKEYEVTLFTNL